MYLSNYYRLILHRTRRRLQRLLNNLKQTEHCTIVEESLLFSDSPLEAAIVVSLVAGSSVKKLPTDVQQVGEKTHSEIDSLLH
jgi:hypothetical protein